MAEVMVVAEVIVVRMVVRVNNGNQDNTSVSKGDCGDGGSVDLGNGGSGISKVGHDGRWPG